MQAGQSNAVRVAAALSAVTAVTTILGLLGTSNAATASISYLMVVLVVAATSRLRVAVITSVGAMLCLNYFFLPPVGTFTIDDSQNWVALFAFVAVSLVASHLSAEAQARTAEALERRDELVRLFDLGRDVLMVTDSTQALDGLSRSVARRFDLEFVAVALPRADTWDVHTAGLYVTLEPGQLTDAFAAAQTALEFDAYSRTYTGHRTVMRQDREIRLVPLRAGARPIGILAASGRAVEPGTLDALAGLVALAVERASLLEGMKAGELARQGEQLKTALLASLSHDLRTPLTAIRVAASNLKDLDLTTPERIEQSDLVLAESARLARLFENVLDMARIDAGAVATDVRWTYPSEIVAAAREQVDHAIQGHPVDVAVARDVPVQVDPRLTAAALAHLLENAGQYAPPGTAIHINASLTDNRLVLRVRDHGPGIAPADLPHLFERFYRGAAGRGRTSGTGMGLWIVRGLLAVCQGHVWAENCADGGAEFTIAIPAAIRQTPADLHQDS